MFSFFKILIVYILIYIYISILNIILKIINESNCIAINYLSMLLKTIYLSKGLKFLWRRKIQQCHLIKLKEF